MQDQIGRAQELDALLAEPPRTARQMGIRDDRYTGQPTPFRNAPSR
jgi:hypothetical protein